MKCTHCQDEIDLVAAVATSTRSWPSLQILLYVCPKCAKRLYLRFENDSAHIVSPGTVLGPRWDYRDSVQCAGVAVHSERKGLRIRIGNLERVVPPR